MGLTHSKVPRRASLFGVSGFRPERAEAQLSPLTARNLRAHSLESRRGQPERVGSLRSKFNRLAARAPDRKRASEQNSAGRPPAATPTGRRASRSIKCPPGINLVGDQRSPSLSHSHTHTHARTRTEVRGSAPVGRPLVLSFIFIYLLRGLALWGWRHARPKCGPAGRETKRRAARGAPPTLARRAATFVCFVPARACSGRPARPRELSGQNKLSPVDLLHWKSYITTIGRPETKKRTEWSRAAVRPPGNGRHNN